MSILPLLYNELLGRDSFLGDIYDQNFGIGLHPEDVIPSRSLLRGPLSSGYVRPWRFRTPTDSGISNIKYNKDGFKVNLDVQQFKPEELKVKVVDDFLVVEAKHEERSDEHGFVSRQFTRRYKLPEDVDLAALVSKLSSDGVLSLEAPKKAVAESGVREIPITQTNAPALKTKEEATNKMDTNKIYTWKHLDSVPRGPWRESAEPIVTFPPSVADSTCGSPQLSRIGSLNLSE